jgi:hypothetical protein
LLFRGMAKLWSCNVSVHVRMKVGDDVADVLRIAGCDRLPATLIDPYRHLAIVLKMIPIENLNHCSEKVVRPREWLSSDVDLAKAPYNL